MSLTFVVPYSNQTTPANDTLWYSNLIVNLPLPPLQVRGYVQSPGFQCPKWTFRFPSFYYAPSEKLKFRLISASQILDLMIVLPLLSALAKILLFLISFPELKLISFLCLASTFLHKCYKCNLCLIAMVITELNCSRLASLYVELSSCKSVCVYPKIIKFKFGFICVCISKHKNRNSSNTNYFLKQSNSTTNNYKATLNDKIYSIFKLRKKQIIPCVSYKNSPKKVQMFYCSLFKPRSDSHSNFCASHFPISSASLAPKSTEGYVVILKRRRRLLITRCHGIC